MSSKFKIGDYVINSEISWCSSERLPKFSDNSLTIGIKGRIIEIAEENETVHENVYLIEWLDGKGKCCKADYQIELDKETMRNLKIKDILKDGNK